MNKHKITITAMGGIIICLTAALIIAIQKIPKQNVPTSKKTEVTLIPGEIIPADSTYAKHIHNQIVEKGKYFTDTEGIKTSIWFTDDSNTPLIEILCKERTLDNTILPLVVSSMDIVSQEITYGMSHPIKGTGLRINIGNDWNSKDVKLKFNTEYTAMGVYHLPEDPNTTARGQTSKVTFRTPKSLEPGEIYRVNLILIDRIKEKESKEDELK